MSNFLQQVVSGLASGGIYGSLALALVLIYRATGIINFAQGEMATFSTFIAWELINQGLSKWVAFLATLLISFAGGVLLERTIIQSVAAGLGIALVPDQMKKVPHDNVVFRSLTPTVMTESCIAWKADNPSAAMRACIDIVSALGTSMR